MRMRYGAVLLLSLVIVTPLWAGTLSGKVIAVTDADTIKILVKRTQHTIRLAHIDAPERQQPYGTAARQALADLVFQQSVTVVTLEKDRYGRWVGVIILPDGRSVNHHLVWAGYAWWYDDYSDDPVFGALQAQARLAKVGLWAADDPMSPWEWRKREKARHMKGQEAK
jgi:endonuclease YncB( thermonuclease family)